MSVKARLLQAIADELDNQNPVVEALGAGGTLGLVVKLDASGCPKRISLRMEVEHEVERRRPRAVAV